MNSEISIHSSFDASELARKREELAKLQAALVEKELELAELHRTISAFEGEYLQTVGVLYAELDEWNAKLAEYVAMQSPTAAATAAASTARAQADESHATSYREAPTKRLAAWPELKDLFRKVAKSIHPDLALDPAEKSRREQLMANANEAYNTGDIDALRKIIEEWQASPESVMGETVAAQLERVFRRIAQIHKRLHEMQAELAKLLSSDVAQLMAKNELAQSTGRDLLAEIGEDVRRQIAAAREKFRDAIAIKAKS